MFGQTESESETVDKQASQNSLFDQQKHLNELEYEQSQRELILKQELAEVLKETKTTFAYSFHSYEETIQNLKYKYADFQDERHNLEQ
jgi:thiamine biosynthesis lipoprotein ApbE